MIPAARRVMSGAVASTVLVGTTVVALQTPTPDWELRLTEWTNDAPDAAGWALYPVMQLGAGLAPIVVAGVVYVARRDRWRAGVIAVAGLGSWFAAKALKQLVGRARPLEFIPGIEIREGDGSGLGFPSGHAAVAASLAVTVAAVVPRRARPLLAAVAGLVGLARIVYGVHLPVDVIGGWSLGILVGVTVTSVVERWRA